MNLLKIDYREDNVHKEIVSTLASTIPTDREVIIVNIGTDRAIGDAVGPLVGTMLDSLGVRVKVYGTLEEPIHALNIRGRFADIKETHPDAYIVAVDACLGVKSHIGQIQIRKAPISPGKGVGKNLPRIGDLSVVAIVDKADENNRYSFNDIRLDFVMKLAEVISFGIYGTLR